jgi:hypothetical protein
MIPAYNIYAYKQQNCEIYLYNTSSGNNTTFNVNIGNIGLEIGS